MDCKYSHRENIDDLNKSQIFCDITKEICHACRYCPTKRKIVNFDNLEKKCIIYKNKISERGRTLENPNKVLFPKRNKLCVELNENTAVMVDNPFKVEEIPLYVKLYKRNKKYYIKRDNEVCKEEK